MGGEQALRPLPLLHFSSVVQGGSGWEGAESFEPDPLVTNISVVALSEAATRKLEKAESLVRTIFCSSQHFSDYEAPPGTCAGSPPAEPD